MRGYMRNAAIAAVLVATVTTLAVALAQSGNLWLVIRGAGSYTEAQNYYSQINAPATFQDWLTQYYNQGTEVAAMYYNAGDLGFGREMRCKQANNGDIACYVVNHGLGPASAVDISLDAAIDNTLILPTVAMVYDASRDGLPNDVKFYVYDDTQRLNTVPLDSEGFKATPHLCLSCHGGAYDNATHSVNGASFLPFDTAAFKYSNRSGYTLSDQQEAFRKLNRLVKQSNPAPAITQLIDGWYAAGGGVGSQGAQQDEGYVIPPYDGNSSDRALYLRAIKPFCRSCHVAQTVDLTNLAQLNAARDNVFPPPGASPFRMPHAEQTFHNFIHGFDSDPVQATRGIKALANTQGWTLRVTKTADTNDGVCNSDCSLREAVIEANRAGNPSPAVITFDVDGEFRLTRSGEDNTANNGDLDLRRPIVILGNDAGSTVINGNESDRVFHIMGGVEVTLQNLTIREGRTAGIYTYGGGIAIEGAPPPLLSGGGALINGTPTVKLIAVDLRGNRAPGDTGVGGAIANIDGNLTIERSSIGPNNQAFRAGGIYNGEALRLENVTLSGNRADDIGGGLLNYGEGASTTLMFSTISDNSASDGGGIANMPGTRNLVVFTGDIDISASIIGGNHAPQHPECANLLLDGFIGRLINNGNNRIGASGDSGGCPAATGETIQSSIDAVIAPKLSRAANGVYYHKLSFGSVAIDVIPGDSCVVPRYDVLNTARPTDGNGDGAAGCDAGAYEAGTRVTISPLSPDQLADDGFCGLREALLSADSGVSSGKKAGECPGGAGQISLASNAVYTLSGSALVVGSNVTLEGNNASIVQPENGERALIVTEGGTLNMRNVTLSAAPAGAQVSRIRAGGAITMGGGLLIAPGGVANITNSAIVRFRSGGPGGGVLNFGVLNLANSTISGNRSDGSGGGIHNAGVARMSFVTIADNVADAEGDGAGDGGGLANEGFALLRANLIARNQDGPTGAQHADLSSAGGQMQSGGYNVIGVDPGATDGLLASDARGTAGAPLDAGIGALGGTPPRHTLNAGSPALRRVPAAACRFVSELGNELFGADEAAAVDQTGAARGAGGGACAAGAVESNAPGKVWLPLLTRARP